MTQGLYKLLKWQRQLRILSADELHSEGDPNASPVAKRTSCPWRMGRNEQVLFLVSYLVSPRDV